MAGARWSQTVLVLAVVVAGCGWSARSVAGAAGTGVVVATGAVNIRSCPELGCKVLAAAPLGASLSLLGEAANGYLSVGYAGVTGYAYGLYVAPTGGPPPLFDAGATGCDRVALIFNVGIGDETSRAILDTLVAERVPATMFLMGWWAKANPDLAREMATRGFVLGTHGHDRAEPVDRSDSDQVQDLRASAAAIAAAAGVAPGPWFTPYAAAMDARVRGIVAAEGYLPVGWRVAGADYGPDATAAGVYNRIVPNVSDGSIVELHLDGPATAVSTAVALPWVVADLRAQGYRFVTIPEMAEPCR